MTKGKRDKQRQRATDRAGSILEDVITPPSDDTTIDVPQDRRQLQPVRDVWRDLGFLKIQAHVDTAQMDRGLSDAFVIWCRCGQPPWPWWCQLHPADQLRLAAANARVEDEKYTRQFAIAAQAVLEGQDKAQLPVPLDGTGAPREEIRAALAAVGREAAAENGTS